MNVQMNVTNLPEEDPQPRRLSLGWIVEAVSLATGVSLAALLGRGRAARVASARQLAMALARQLTDLSLAEIGEQFHRDHGTVIHARKAVKARCETSREHAEQWDRLVSILKP